MKADDICSVCSHPRLYHGIDPTDEQRSTICGECVVSSFKVEIRRARHAFAEPIEPGRMN